MHRNYLNPIVSKFRNKTTPTNHQSKNRNEIIEMNGVWWKNNVNDIKNISSKSPMNWEKCDIPIFWAKISLFTFNPIKFMDGEFACGIEFQIKNNKNKIKNKIGWNVFFPFH